MPIYKKGRSVGVRLAEEKQKGKKDFSVNDLDNSRIELVWKKIKGKYIRFRKYVPSSAKWTSEEISLFGAEQGLRFPITKTARLMVLLEKKQGRKPLIVDWGCGKEIATEQLGKTLGDEARVIGFGDIMKKEWIQKESVEFIHGESSSFFRYFKDNSINILYSHYGIMHLTGAEIYIKNMIKKIAPAGFLVTHLENKELRNFLTENVKNYSPAIQNGLFVPGEREAVINGIRCHVKWLPAPDGLYNALQIRRLE